MKSEEIMVLSGYKPWERKNLLPRSESLSLLNQLKIKLFVGIGSMPVSYEPLDLAGP
jgi:hypothetical protein